jgi:Uma2 family endonuclease
MTYLEYQQRFDEDAHVEWVDGEAIVFMSPNTRHQRIVDYLTMLLGIFIRVYNLGELFEAPYAMRIHPDGNVREPDILFVAQENAHRIDAQRLNGPADLVIEVISTESLYRDRSDKFYEYQVGGVREYWVIDPRPGVTWADFWVLDEEGRYRPVPVDANGIYVSSVLPNFKLNVSGLLADKVPDPLKDAAALVDADAMMRAMGYIK